MILGVSAAALSLSGLLGFQQASSWDWAGSAGDSWDWAGVSSDSWDWAVPKKAASWDWAMPDAAAAAPDA